MTYAPTSLRGLRSYLVTKTGLSLISLGIVGDAAHARRASYHNGWDRIRQYGRTSATDYSIRTARDRAYPRTDAAMAIDIGNFRGLRAMSVAIVTMARSNAPGTRDMREIIYSPDGRTVLRWDRERGYSSAPRTGEADDSHLFHTHISYYRDSEQRSKLAPFVAYFDPPAPPPSPVRYRVTIPSHKPEPLRYSSGRETGTQVSGLSLIVRDRLPNKVRCPDGVYRWLYQIVEGKYAGRYLAPTGNTTFTRIQ